MNFNEIAHNLSFGYYRPHFPKDSFEAGWNLISQKGAINKALKAAYEAGQQSAQQGVVRELLRPGADDDNFSSAASRPPTSSAKPQSRKL